MKITVGVIFGGRSVENEISVITANQLIEAMDKRKYVAVPIYIAKNGKWYSGEKLLDVANYRNMEQLFRRTDEVYLRPVYGDNCLYRKKKWFWQKRVAARLDVIIPALHGTNCEDGSFQGVIEFTGIPYGGCNPLASANGMDKITMKMILRECGIPVVDYVWFSDKEWQNEKQTVIGRIEEKLAYPVIVKPANSGSSVGIKAAHDREQLVEAIDGAVDFTNRIIVEVLVERLREINCSVLGNYYECEPSVCEAPVRSGEILSYADKYLGGGKAKVSKGMQSTVREIPANLPPQTTDFIRRCAVDTFKALACDGVSRIDFMIDEATDKVYVNEINTIPGSLSYYLWEYTGLPFPALVDRLVEIAFQRKRDAGFKTINYGDNIFNCRLGGGKMGPKTGFKMGPKMRK